MKLLTSVVASMLVLTFGIFGVVFAADGPLTFGREEALGGLDTATRLANACKDKKPGTEVVVDGKRVKCPVPGNSAGIAIPDPGTSSRKSQTIYQANPDKLRGKPSKEQ
ncbi:MAG: hypothetical protein ACMG6H_12630 [Acidobacteriota bacterium]